MDNAPESPETKTWIQRYVDYGRQSIETIELQRAKQFELLIDARGQLRTLRANWRDAKDKQLPPDIIKGLADAMEAMLDSVDEAKEGYALISAERDRRVADNRANLSLVLSGAAFCVSCVALVLTVLAFLLKGWH